MGYNNFGQIVDTINSGQSFYTGYRKVPAVVTVAGVWHDMSMAPGIPGPNYYASTPLVSETLSSSLGIQTGGNVSPRTKHIKSITASTTIAAVHLMLCDYLLYYPFIDMGDTEIQTLINSESLSRYSDGKGVQMMAVEVGPQLGSQSFRVQYTNQDGVEGMVTPNIACNTVAVNGTLINSTTATVSGMGPFLPLAPGDTGVRKIESIQMTTADVGLITLVLVKPLANLSTIQAQTAVEVDFLRDKLSMPQVFDGAYLNFLACGTASMSAVPVFGDITYIWN